MLGYQTVQLQGAGRRPVSLEVGGPLTGGRVGNSFSNQKKGCYQSTKSCLIGHPATKINGEDSIGIKKWLLCIGEIEKDFSASEKLTL